MIKPFLTLFTLLALLIIGVTLHYKRYNYSLKQKRLNQIVTLTSNASLSLSMGYDKKRDIKSSYSNYIYPELPSTSSMEFVYAQ
jgi:hypothetical protein